MTKSLKDSGCSSRAHGPAEPGAGPCPLCDRSRCSASAKGRVGERCRRNPVPGCPTCKVHGSGTAAARDAGQRRLEERRALLALETFGLPRAIDPHAALLEELHRTAGAVDWLGAVVADIEQNRIAWGRTRESSGEDSGTTTWSAGPNAYVDLWQRERKHLLEVAKACISAGIEERRVRLAESAGQQLAGVVRAVLDRMLAALIAELGPERATEIAFESVWAAHALAIVPEEFRRLGDVVPGEAVAG